MKKLITALLITSFLTINITPVLAIDDVNKSTAAPKQFKSLVKKTKRSKKLGDQYKYDYVNIAWWQQFNDDKLDGYIAQAIKNNYDLKMATLAVEEYYQQTRLQFSNELPSLTVGFSPNVAKMQNKTKVEGMFALPAVMMYEADIFLKNRDKTKSVKKLWEGSQLDERSAYISIVSAVGTVYLNILKLDKLIELQENIVQDRKQIYELMLLRNKEGITSTADTVRSNKAYVAGAMDLLELKKQREMLLHQMCVLIGQSPDKADTLERNSIDDLKFTGVIPNEISSEVIMQRPDYEKAEKMVEKAGIDVRVARKEFLPVISLNGLALFSASQLGSLFSTKGMMAALGGFISLPAIGSGAKIANLRLRKTTYERILQNYYKTNLTAIQEVNDSLVTIKVDEEKYDKTKKQMSLEKTDFAYNQQKYEQGIISKLDLIQMKENLLDMDKLLTANKVACFVDYIGLYKSVGSKL